MHLTGRYPSWWTGRRFNYAIRAMTGSESAELTRKGVQRLLLGPPEMRDEWGTGAIPHDCVRDTSMKQGVPDAVSSIVVRHECGEDSVLQFLSYDQGRTKWQADTVDLVWMDEEPPQPIYSEALTRTNATAGMVFVTFTPLLGMSDVVKRFLLDKPPSSHVTTMTIDDVDHYTDEEKARIIASYPEHEREARTKGIPVLGSGRIYPVTEDSIARDAFAVPRHWGLIGGMDFGWDHPFGAARLAWDRDTDTIYVTRDFRQRELAPIAARVALSGWDLEWLPWAWPHDGLQHDKGSGEALAEQYRKHGVKMLKDRATHAPEKDQKEGEGGNGVEAGLMMMLDRMQTGKLKVAAHLNDWFEEFRLYHREDGKVVKLADDLMSATRYALMMLRHAKTGQKPVAKALAPTYRPSPGTGVMG
jgi:phage terminase large subunit-like protein